MNKKMLARKRRQARRVAMTLCLMLAVALVSVGGTIAWLTANTDPVVNTFTVGNINIDLEETWNTDSNDDGTNDKWEAEMTPGTSYVKDPKVTVEADSEKCYLFVKVDVAGSIQYVDYALNTEGWTAGDGTEIPANVYYRVVNASSAPQSWYLLQNKANIQGANGSVKILDTLTKENLEADGFIAPSITFTAYACQFENRTAAQAWDAVPKA